jgi:hypothetical protein
MLASTSGMQINEEQHLRELETNQENRKSGRVKKIWMSLLTKRGTTADSRAEQKTALARRSGGAELRKPKTQEDSLVNFTGARNRSCRDRRGDRNLVRRRLGRTRRTKRAEEPATSLCLKQRTKSKEIKWN